ncbi:PepSY domain-containing protein [Streptomyces sp. NPDC093085]|uniref:PepSY domain-containing protein n=1 Tax=Streptomyces sp. NPDC093085 TaxID=3155068 RepID=UPI00342221CE
MKRNIVIAAITSAVLIGGGTYTAAMALTGGQGDDRGAAPVVPVTTATPSSPSEPGDDNGTDVTASPTPTASPTRTATPSPTADTPRAPLTAADAVKAAIAARPGAVSSVEASDDGGTAAAPGRWEVDLFTVDGRKVELRVNATTGAVRVHDDDAADDDDRNDDKGDDRDDDRGELAALRAATVDAGQAMSAALATVPGRVVSAELDDDPGEPWEVEVRGDDGLKREVHVNPTTGTVTLGTVTLDRHHG